MSRHRTPIKKIRYGSLVYEILFDTLIGDAIVNIHLRKMTNVRRTNQ
jgi:hypothetical protein